MLLEMRPSPVTTGIEAFPALTPTLPPATHTNSYALGVEKVLLVEAATPYAEEQKAWLAWTGGLKTTREIVGILLTHHHYDHAAGAQTLSSALGVPVLAHEETAALVDLPVDTILKDGDEVALGAQCWRVLHTPGHAPGHLCLWEPKLRYLVAGDMIASEGTILIDPAEGDMTEYLAQLERLRELDSVCILPAHGAPIREPFQALSHYLEHRKMREEKVLEALRSLGSRGGTVDELVAMVYDDVPMTAWPLASMSLRAHLDKLVAEFRVRRVGSSYWVS